MQLHIVITRFHEPWANIQRLYEFLCVENTPWKHANFIIYNRGPEPTKEERESLSPNTTIIESPNVGREAYVILEYIVSNYESLPDIIMFCSASWCNNEGKKISLSSMIVRYENNMFVPTAPRHWSCICDGIVDIWYGSTEANLEIVKKMSFKHSDIRPYGKWYEKRIKNTTGREWQNNICHYGMFTVHRESILRYPQSQWQDWLQEIAKDGPNSELAHYWEWSWASLLS